MLLEPRDEIDVWIGENQSLPVDIGLNTLVRGTFDMTTRRGALSMSAFDDDDDKEDDLGADKPEGPCLDWPPLP